MKKLILTSPKYIGKLTLGYNDTEQLIFYHNETDIEPERNERLLPYLPLNGAALPKFAKWLQAEVVEVPMDLSFGAFWEWYNRKINKKRSEPLHDKLDDADRALAFTRAMPYQKYRTGKGQAIADPEKYLRDRLFDTDWAKMK